MDLLKNMNVRTNLAPKLSLWLGSWLQPERTADRLAQSFLAAPPRRRVSDQERAAFAAADALELSFEGERLKAYRFGDGPKVLLLHGQGGNAQQLHAFIAPLSAAGFQVVALDAPGHGASTGNWLAIPRYGAAIAAAAQQLGPFHGVIAHSLGAPAATFAMMLGTQFDRAVFVGAPADAFVYFVHWARKLALPASLVGLTKRSVERRAGYELERINAERLGGFVQAPLLVIHDAQDREVPYRDGERVAQASKAQLLTTTGLGHRRILQSPDVVQAAVTFITNAASQARVA